MAGLTGTAPPSHRAAVRRQGLRMTGQRRVIARVLSGAKDHPDVEEVYRRANAIDPRISLSTVYRTSSCSRPTASWSATISAPAAGAMRRPPRGHHDHLIDIETGRVIEFRNEEIERMQERVARELGFNLVGHKLELYGVPMKRARK